MSDEDGLTPQESAAIAALLVSRTVQDAAAAAGISERTLRRWLTSREHFRTALRREQRATMAAVTARLQQVALKAVDTLEDVMEDGEASHASKVTAARALLELAQERIDMDEVAQRLEAIERGLHPSEQGSTGRQS